MPDYSLAELARLADVTPRTVRYYVAQGLLPSPDAAGPATRYGDAHLARLRLIRRLQRDHLPLAEIRARLGSMSEEAIEAAVQQPPVARQGGETALDYVRTLLAREAPAPYLASRLMRVADAMPRETPDAFPMRDPGTGVPIPPPGAPPAPPAATPAPPPASYPARSTPAPQPDRSTWERISLDPDVELHVRRPLGRATNKRVEQLVRIARELFEADTS